MRKLVEMIIAMVIILSLPSSLHYHHNCHNCHNRDRDNSGNGNSLPGQLMSIGDEDGTNSNGNDMRPQASTLGAFAAELTSAFDCNPHDMIEEDSRRSRS